jgi:hypothetical protein
MSKGTLERGERENKSSGNQSQMNMVICLPEFSSKELVPVEEATKARSIQTLSLSQSVTKNRLSAS